jgi:HEAT repeat protein
MRGLLQRLALLVLCQLAGVAAGLSQSGSLEQDLDQMRSPEATVRQQACDALGKLRDRRAVAPPSAALIDKSPEVRKHAAAALGELGDPSAVASLAAAFNAVEGTYNEQYYEGASYLAALGKLGAPAFESLLAATRISHGDLRRLAYSTLFATGDPRAFDVIVQALKIADAVIPIAAQEALARSTDPRAVGVLIAALKDPQVQGKVFIASALASTGSRAIEPLVAMLSGDSGVTRQYAAQALAGIDDPIAKSSLLAALKRGDLDAIAGAYEFFVQWGEHGTEDLIIAALDHSNDGGRMAQYLIGCGNAKIEAAARAWGEQRNWTLEPSTLGNEWGLSRGSAHGARH